MGQLDSPEIAEYIVEQIKKSADTDDIILTVCEKTNADWKEARAFVEKLSVEKKDEITLAQSPILVVLALGTFLIGAGLFFGMLYRLAQDVLSFLDFRMITLGITGLGMMIGSLKGMEDVWLAVLKKMGIL